MCLIDASKAFDRVHHDMLFQMLIERGLPAGVLRTLLDSYKMNNYIVRSYRYVIVVNKIATRRSSKAQSIVMY